jgi:serine/threonine-protein kinase HipA
LTPAVLRAFAEALGVPEKPAAAALRECVKAAYAVWPEMILRSLLTGQQKGRLLQHFKSHPAVVTLERRAYRAAAKGEI